MFDNGAGVEVVDNQGYMSTRVYMPWSFIVSRTVFFQISTFRTIKFG